MSAHTYERARADCQQDRCENTPFASVGGLDKRTTMEAPEHIPEVERDSYIAGYKYEAAQIYGDGWDKAEWSWKPALGIEAQS